MYCLLYDLQDFAQNNSNWQRYMTLNKLKYKVVMMSKLNDHNLQNYNAKFDIIEWTLRVSWIWIQANTVCAYDSSWLIKTAHNIVLAKRRRDSLTVIGGHVVACYWSLTSWLRQNILPKATDLSIDSPMLCFILYLDFH